MKIVIAGGTGFLGAPLCAALASRGHDVVVLSRGAGSRRTFGRVVPWQPDGSAASGRAWVAEIDGADAIVNLAGASIAGARWSDRRKTELRDSRIASTRSLVAAIRSTTRRPAVLVSSSGVGYYGASDDRPLDESFPPGSDFLATLCVDWEAEAHAASALGCRVAIVRTGVPLATDGGALKELLRPFLFFGGGPIASGRQYMSWIHREDWVAMIEWIVGTASADGVFNATAPNPATNEQFSAALGRALHRPSWIRVPRLALRAIVGEISDVLVTGQRVIPKRALDRGFTFRYESVDAALRDAVRAR